MCVSKQNVQLSLSNKGRVLVPLPTINIRQAVSYRAVGAIAWLGYGQGGPIGGGAKGPSIGSVKTKVRFQSTHNQGLHQSF